MKLLNRHQITWRGNWKMALVAAAAGILLLALAGEIPVFRRPTSDKVDGALHSAAVTGSGNIRQDIKALYEKVDMLQRRFWLEPLSPVFQYRAKYYLGKTSDVEDKDQVTPYFLANFVNASDSQIYKRRIYIDLGLKDFDSSLCWMMQNYPVKFDYVYGFECTTDLGADKEKLRQDARRCIKGTAAAARGYDPEEILRNLQLHHNYIGVQDDAGTNPPTLGLNRFIKDQNIQPDDFVVLKMDVEGVEYDLLAALLADDTYKLVDEVFVEIHYAHPEMSAFGWDAFAQSRSDAQALFTRARDMGLFIHPWP